MKLAAIYLLAILNNFLTETMAAICAMIRGLPSNNEAIRFAIEDQ